MKTLLALVTFAAVIFAAPSFARADDAADKAKLKEIEKSCAAALVKGDYDVLDRVFADDWTLVDTMGNTMSKPEIFKDLKSGDLKFQAYELTELDVRVIGDTAVVIGHGTPHGQFRGEAFEEAEVFTDTFVRKDGQWRLIVTHSVSVPKQ